MEQLSFSSASEIENYLSGFGEEFLFRGQVSHFTTGEGGVSITSSQARKGCDPSQLFKWSHYASEVIGLLRGDTVTQVEPDLAQAVLQHYGWRSFFVDLTAHYGAAAWFGSHGWSGNRSYVDTEDCSEHSVVTAHESAHYSPTTEPGHIYILSRSELLKAKIKCIDLCKAIPIDLKLRFKAQHAWLAGPLGAQPLPYSAIHAHISAPASALAEVAANRGFRSTHDLFPRREEDAILDLLLEAPRCTVENNSVFLPELLIPEYDFRMVKPFPPQFAFYKKFWLADDRLISDRFTADLQDVMFVRVSEHLLYAGRPWVERSRFPFITELLRASRIVIIESEGIAKILSMRELCEYTKGLYLRLVTPSLVEVSELRVEHPGVMVAQIGTTQGWYYRIVDDGTWIREVRDEECRCGNIILHLRHIWALQWVEDEILARPQLTHSGDKNISLL